MIPPRCSRHLSAFVLTCQSWSIVRTVQSCMIFEELHGSHLPSPNRPSGQERRRPPRPARPSAEIRRVADLLKQVSDPTRLQVLMLLNEKERNVSELCADLGTQSQPAVSHHLAPAPPRPVDRAAALGQAQLLRPDRRGPRARRGRQLGRRLSRPSIGWGSAASRPGPGDEDGPIAGAPHSRQGRAGLLASGQGFSAGVLGGRGVMIVNWSMTWVTPTVSRVSSTALALALASATMPVRVVARLP